jgi:PERQ amino acid-rich with GYF domain-containing protein
LKDPLGFNPLGNNISQLLQTQLLNTTASSANNNNIPSHVLQALIQQNNLKIENNDTKKGPVGLAHPEADKWLYLDPQNQVQGTFTSEEMAAWFAAGYFTLNLMIKRGCDDQFLPLGVVAKNWGRLPFLAGSQPPPLLKVCCFFFF